MKDTNFVYQRHLTNRSSWKPSLRKKLFPLENLSGNLDGSQIKGKDSDTVTKSDVDDKTTFSVRVYNEDQKLVYLSKTHIDNSDIDGENGTSLKSKVEFDLHKSNNQRRSSSSTQ